jgi:hypothetical protein
MMDQKERDKIIYNLSNFANENKAGLFTEMVSLLSDMENRISVLEAKAVLPIPPTPIFGIPTIPESRFMAVNERREKYNLPSIRLGYEGKEKDLYLHLLEKGLKESEAADIAKEIEKIGCGQEIYRD